MRMLPRWRPRARWPRGLGSARGGPGPASSSRYPAVGCRPPPVPVCGPSAWRACSQGCHSRVHQTSGGGSGVGVGISSRYRAE
uniref:Uncharacterized protein n=1 Tax=uncultured marine virus TaxID=186617 RepID=A0A0F7L3K6_9VIRU|nr:hypothetical protein [uncultured marine virus]